MCPNGHAMDDGLFNCPACGAYRPSASTPSIRCRICGMDVMDPAHKPAWCETVAQHAPIEAEIRGRSAIARSVRRELKR